MVASADMTTGLHLLTIGSAQVGLSFYKLWTSCHSIGTASEDRVAKASAQALGPATGFKQMTSLTTTQSLFRLNLKTSAK